MAMKETKFTLAKINAGEYDKRLLAWGKNAKKDGRALLVEYGTEMNGSWFAWNGWWNGKSAAPFVSAYKRIVDIIRGQAGATNITWVFHPASDDDPHAGWNELEKYYPGHDYVDWLGFSAYGAQSPNEIDCYPFKGQMVRAYKRLAALGGNTKPIILAEFGCSMGCQKCCLAPNTDASQGPADWADAAFKELLKTTKYPLLKGFSWWSSRWNEGRGVVANMRVDQAPHLGDVFKNHIDSNVFVLDRPIIL